jgi:flagellar biosynthesis protein FlhG
MSSDNKHIRVISVIGAESGVGNHTISLNLAAALSSEGMKVLLLDPENDSEKLSTLVRRVLERCTESKDINMEGFNELFTKGPAGIKIISAENLKKLSNETPDESKDYQHDYIEILSTLFDFVIIDAAEVVPSGSEFGFLQQSVENVIVLRSERITKMYSLIKQMAPFHSKHNFKIIVTNALNVDEALEIFRKFANLAGRFLDISLDYLGCVIQDDKITEYAEHQMPVVELYSESPFAKSFANLAHRLIENKKTPRIRGPIHIFPPLDSKAYHK